MKHIIIAIVLIAGLLVAGRFIFFNENKDNIEAIVEIKEEILDREVIIEIESGNTFSDITENVGIGGTLMTEILEATTDIYDLTKIRVGREMKFYFDKHFNGMTYQWYNIFRPAEQNLTILRKTVKTHTLNG